MAEETCARKHGFIQPLVDRAFFEGLDRYEHVNVAFEHMLIGLEDSGDLVTASLEVGPRDMDGTTDPLAGTTPTTRQVRAKFVVGCEGGRSFTRKWLGATFVGESPSTRWLVVDVENDPVGTPGVYLGADPKRPYVSIGLPHAVRRWEFMLHEDEPSDVSEDNAFVHGLLTPHVPDPTSLQVLRRRVFTTTVASRTPSVPAASSSRATPSTSCPCGWGRALTRACVMRRASRGRSRRSPVAKRASTCSIPTTRSGANTPRPWSTCR